MSTKLPPVPHQSPLADQNGRALSVWSDWFNQVFSRVGGNVAQSNDELTASVTALSPKLVPTGGLLPFAGSSAPTGFLLCDGSAVSRTTYAALYSVIGVVWGAGDGSTTFNLPDMRGRFPVGKAAAGTFASLAGTGGAETAALPDHVHSGTTLSTGGPSGTTTVAGGAGATVASSGHTHGVTGNTGSATTFPSIATLPPYAVLNYLVKT